MIEFIQVFMVLFALFAFSRSVLRARDRAITRREFVFWSALWSGVILLTLFPTIMRHFADFVGISRGVDSILYLSVVLLFYLIFRLYVKIDKTNQDLTRLVRKLAIGKK